MSEPNVASPARIGLVGATGLIGRCAIEESSKGDEARIVGITRREASLPEGARVEIIIAQQNKWGDVLAAVKPKALICALGSTWKKSGRDEAAFRAVDFDLVLASAQAAHKAGILNMVLVSSVGADANSKQFYLRVKGEVEREVSKIGFNRLDILRPGLLRGKRQGDPRFKEGLAQMVSPLIDPFLPEKWQQYGSIEASIVAQAALGLALRIAPGRFTHDNASIKKAALQWRMKSEG